MAELTGSLFGGEGKYYNTASSKGWTPKFLTEAPIRTGDTLDENLEEITIFLIAFFSLEEGTYSYFKYISPIY